MTTHLEILDTAVKIGLGALIAGAATYWVTNLKGRLDAHQERTRALRANYEKMSLAVEQTADAIGSVIFTLNRSAMDGAAPGKQAIGDAYANYHDVFKSLNQAQALATLVGTHEIRQALLQYTQECHGLHDALHRLNLSNENLNQYLSRINDAHTEVRRSIREAYSKVGAA